MITIIGAGIGGLSTALAFEKLDIPYQLYERAHALSEVGAGIWLAPNPLQVFDWLGILDQVQNTGNRIDRITIGDRQINPISDSPQGQIKDHFGFVTTAIHRADLQRLLYDQLPKEKIHLGCAFEKFEQLDDGKVRTHFDNGEKVEADFLIGADGIHSKVRNQIFPDSETRYSGQTCWRGVAAIDLPADFYYRGVELWGDQIRFGFSQVKKGHVYWFAVALDEPGVKDDRSTIKNQLMQQFKGFHPLVQEVLRHTTEDKILRNDIYDLKPMKKWWAGQVGLIGDAGHATTPNMGQGGAQAIEDAYYLAHVFHKNGISAGSFEAFQKMRSKKVNQIVNRSAATGKMAHWKYGKTLRNMIIKSVPVSLVNKSMIQMYTIKKMNP